MSKVLVDGERLDLLIKFADLSGHSVLNNGIIKSCCMNPCEICVFYDNYDCSFNSENYEGIIKWLKGDEVNGKDRSEQG